jgi:hypothetical protein
MKSAKLSCPFVDLEECYFIERAHSEIRRLELRVGSAVYAQENDVGSLLVFASGNDEAVLTFSPGEWGFVEDLEETLGVGRRRLN